MLEEKGKIDVNDERKTDGFVRITGRKHRQIGKSFVVGICLVCEKPVDKAKEIASLSIDLVSFNCPGCFDLDQPILIIFDVGEGQWDKNDGEEDT